MKQLLIYDQPVVLNRTQHRRLRIRPALPDFRFAAALNSVPLTAAEFADAARDYPIVFAGSPESASMPVVLLGLSQEDNLFVDADGQWAADTYIPAFLRRYPFVVADQGGEGEQLNVCIDQSFVCEGDDGVPLFDEQGGDTPMLARALDFLADYQQAVERSQDFMRQLRESALLIPKTIQLERNGQPGRSLQGFCVVDEARLQKLPSKALQKLSRSGVLGLLYVHLMSLNNVRRLSARMDARAPLPLH